MNPIFQVPIFLILTLTFIICQKGSDEGRPYEFGFTIEGQQHRHEKKDENGIIQGEFGFITADGIYHVTVYATDENGNFKILSMKNIRISAPLDGSPATGPISPEANKYLKKSNKPESPMTQPSSQPQPQQYQRLEQQPRPLITVMASTPKSQAVFTTKPTVKPACAGCGYVTTSRTTITPDIGSKSFSTIVEGVVPQSDKVPSQYSSGVSVQYPSSTTSQNANGISSQYPNVGSPLNSTRGYQSPIILNQSPPDVEILPPNFQHSIHVPDPNEHLMPIQDNKKQQEPVYGYQNDQNSSLPTIISDKHSGDLLVPGNNGQVSGRPTDQLVSLGNQTNQKEYVDILANLPDTGMIPNLAGRSGQLNAPPASTETSKLPPITVSDNSIHVGGTHPQDIPIQNKFPGMVDGLPNGVEEKDVTNILYRFKYTVGFHGHYEKGLKDGTKIGGYFINGRDGFSRVVTYVADENGYRPKFKLINLGLDSVDTPKEDTEKTFGLKSFEFIWYPIE
ncbi:unnamed protein product [Phaedon cochleariae]|uniref:Protein lethal(3)malignant blood neoplasm 1 n=1 Tax=Phaedon cochleariae TaxID=80249 RepID=A0A9P0GKI6_PHACE|nr:unnamed protein product [Phaedon cochleariae]